MANITEIGGYLADVWRRANLISADFTRPKVIQRRAWWRPPRRFQPNREDKRHAEPSDGKTTTANQ